MPAKYVIHTIPTEPRYEPLSKSGVIAWEEGCLKCPECVKTKCVYKVYENRQIDPFQMIESLDNQCMNCFRCIQSCPKQLIHKSFNREFDEMGAPPFTPEIISKIWQQATRGQVPVSGAGYHGPFTGPGFDSMWTDMSEIVRPTRDGIHGREYISTAVEIGERPDHLTFQDMDIKDEYNFITIPLPIILRTPRYGRHTNGNLWGWIGASRYLKTIFSMPFEEFKALSIKNPEDVIIEIQSLNELESFSSEVCGGIEFPSIAEWETMYEVLSKRYPRALKILRVPMETGMMDVIKQAFNKGIRIFHVQGTFEGTFTDSDHHIKDGIRKVHLELLDMGVRDQVTVLISGGIAMAEHVAKAIICGADAVYADTVIQLALECRLCKRCELGVRCPVHLEEAEPVWVARRVINLMGAWHNQLLEVLGAMGLRDVRRLRGEVGRAMFFEDLERETFESLNKLEQGEEIEDN